MEGRQITLAMQVDGQHFETNNLLCTSVKQLLPKDPSVGRKEDLIQFFSDRGLRTASVASLRPNVRRKRAPKQVSASVEDDDE